MSYRLAIFDFDGTLADTFPWFMRVVNTVADRFRFKRIEEHEVEHLRGCSAREIVKHLEVPPWKLPFIARPHATPPGRGRRWTHPAVRRKSLRCSCPPLVGGRGFSCRIVSSNPTKAMCGGLSGSRAGTAHSSLRVWRRPSFGKAAEVQTRLSAKAMSCPRRDDLHRRRDQRPRGRPRGRDRFGAVSCGAIRTPRLFGCRGRRRCSRPLTRSSGSWQDG